MFVIVGDKGRDQIVNLHYMLSKTVVKARPSVLWCYKKDLYLSRYIIQQVQPHERADCGSPQRYTLGIKRRQWQEYASQAAQTSPKPDTGQGKCAFAICLGVQPIAGRQRNT